MRCLFVTDKDINLTFSGAQVMTNRNYLSFVKLYGVNNVDVLELQFLEYKNKLNKLINTFRGYNDFLSPDLVTEIINKSKHYDLIVLDFSTWGIVAKRLKKAGYKGKIVSFFHNLEFIYLWQEAKITSIIGMLKLYCTFINEKLTTKYSDRIISLNSRDANGIFRTYNRKVDLIIPISCKDADISSIDKTKKIDHPIEILFYGSNFWANTNGIKWFVDSVFPELNNVKLIIAGNGMGSLKQDIKNQSNITIFDKVEDLSSLINNADFVINPIFEGSGMKVKTAEALKYGKNIISTKEGFEGYDIDYNKVGALCNSKEEFVDFFKNINIDNSTKFNNYSREVFLKKYSFDATIELFKKI